MAQGGIYRRCEEPEGIEIDEKMESLSPRRAGGFLLQHCRCGSNETSISVLFIVTAASFLLWTIISAVLISKNLEMSTQLEQLRANQSVLITNGSNMEKQLGKIDSSHSKSESELKNELNTLKKSITDSQKSTTDKLRELVLSSNHYSNEITKIEDALLTINASNCHVCPVGWLFRKGTCYHFELKTIHWSYAKKSCEDKGARLVIIHDAEEQEFLRSHSKKKDYWIGLQDLDTEDKFTWIDGTVATYTNWNAGEPNDYGHGEDCVVMTSTGRWNDFSCGKDSEGWICEKEWGC